MQEMNLGSQIKKYRSELSMSQDELAEKVFVSRQSISEDIIGNWFSCACTCGLWYYDTAFPCIEK